MAISATVRAEVTGSSTSVQDQGTASFPFALTYTKSLTDGNAANQIDRVFTDTRTLTASATEDLDVAGVLTNVYGATIAAAKLKGIMVKASSGNTNNVNVTRPASNGVPWMLAAGDGFPVVPDGVFLWLAPSAAGITVTAATGDLITFTNSGAGTSVTYDVALLLST